MVRIPLRMLAVSAFLVGVAGLFTIGHPRAMTQPDGSNVVRALEDEAFRKGGLRAAAQVNGSYTRSERHYSDGDPATLKELAAISHAIVIGGSDRARCEVTSDGRSLQTVYTVHVSSILKGEPLGTIEVVIPGGKVMFPDGTTSEILSPGFLKPQLGRRTVWFLRREGGQNDGSTQPHAVLTRFRPARGPLGVYDLEPDRRTFIAPAGSYAGPLGQRLLREQLSAEDFVTRVVAVVQ